MIAFAISGGLSAFGGVLLAGYASKAAQSMGDPYLLPSIAAVVLGGTSILGGRGTYLGTIAGVILITLLQSILSVMQMPEAGRQIIYGVVIVAMLLLYGRSPASRCERCRQPMRRARRAVHACVVMGVAGCGKIGCRHGAGASAGLDASSKATSLHPPTMSSAWRAGLPLTDEHRWGWLDAIGERDRAGRARAGDGAVAACSALKRAYRDRLRRTATSIAVRPSRDRQGDRGGAGRVAQGPFHAGEPGRQPVRRPRAAGSRRKAVIVRCKASGRPTGGRALLRLRFGCRY